MMLDDSSSEHSLPPHDKSVSPDLPICVHIVSPGTRVEPLSTHSVYFPLSATSLPRLRSDSALLRLDRVLSFDLLDIFLVFGTPPVASFLRPLLLDWLDVFDFSAPGPSATMSTAPSSAVSSTSNSATFTSPVLRCPDLFDSQLDDSTDLTAASQLY